MSCEQQQVRINLHKTFGSTSSGLSGRGRSGGEATLFPVGDSNRASWDTRVVPETGGVTYLLGRRARCTV